MSGEVAMKTKIKTREMKKRFLALIMITRWLVSLGIKMVLVSQLLMVKLIIQLGVNIVPLSVFGRCSGETTTLLNLR
jgi:hypothetical protein